MGHKSYEESIRGVYKGLILLGVVTLLEVGLSLFGKGYIIEGVEASTVVMMVVGLGLIVFSLYKAYFIIYEFMHMGHEVPGLRMSVLLPMALLIWGMIAFFQEGDSWQKRRKQIEEKDKVESEESPKVIGSLLDDKPEEVYYYF